MTGPIDHANFHRELAKDHGIIYESKSEQGSSGRDSKILPPGTQRCKDVQDREPSPFVTFIRNLTSRLIEILPTAYGRAKHDARIRAENCALAYTNMLNYLSKPNPGANEYNQIKLSMQDLIDEAGQFLTSDCTIQHVLNTLAHVHLANIADPHRAVLIKNLGKLSQHKDLQDDQKKIVEHLQEKLKNLYRPSAFRVSDLSPSYADNLGVAQQQITDILQALSQEPLGSKDLKRAESLLAAFPDKTRILANSSNKRLAIIKPCFAAQVAGMRSITRCTLYANLKKVCPGRLAPKNVAIVNQYILPALLNPLANATLTADNPIESVLRSTQNHTGAADSLRQGQNDFYNAILAAAYRLIDKKGLSALDDTLKSDLARALLYLSLVYYFQGDDADSTIANILKKLPDDKVRALRTADPALFGLPSHPRLDELIGTKLAGSDSSAAQPVHHAEALG